MTEPTALVRCTFAWEPGQSELIGAGAFPASMMHGD